jgi:hypothetical protein
MKDLHQWVPVIAIGLIAVGAALAIFRENHRGRHRS